MDESLRSLHAETDKLFDKRPPVRDEMQASRLEKLRGIAKQLAHGIIDVVPEGVEKDQALAALRQAFLWIEVGVEANQNPGIPRISAARITEAEAVGMRDSGRLPGES